MASQSNMINANGDASHSPSPATSWFSIVLFSNLLTPEIENAKYEGHGTIENPYRVTFLPRGRDPRSPLDFSLRKRWLISALAAMSCFAISLTSSAYTGGISGITSEFEVSDALAQAGVSLFVLGFAVGPLFWAPLSEIYGRQPIMIITLGTLVVFNAASAGAKTITQLLVFRALAGIVGSSPLTNAAALIADLFDVDTRGLALGLFAFGPYMGPVVGPIVGGYLGASAGGWRAILWLCTGLCGAMWIACTMTCPETYAPLLLRRRAEALTQKTGRVYVSAADILTPRRTPVERMRAGLILPCALLIMEPIVLILSIYMAIAYATMYMLFAAYPIIFKEQRGWSAGTVGLAFVAIAIGMMIALAYMVYENERFKARVSRSPTGRAAPEARLPICMIGGVLVTIGLFWFAWSNSPNVHWIVCLLGTSNFAIGNVLLYLGCMNYLVDAYVVYTASCMAGSSVLRSVLGAAFPLFTRSMYDRLGIHWASSVPAFLALACVPFPFLFARYGQRIRSRCRYAAEAQKILDNMMEKQRPSDETVSEK